MSDTSDDSLFLELAEASPPSPALHSPRPLPSTPSTHLVYPIKKQPNPPLSVTLPSPSPATPPAYGEPTLTPPPRSPGPTPASGDGKHHPPDGTSSDKSSETAVGGVSRSGSAAGALSRKESYKAQRQHYRREKKRAASALLHSIEDPSVVVLSDWLKVRGSLKSWTKLWCVLKPGLLLLYKSPKAKSSHWVGTVLLTSCQVIERPSKKDGFCFKLYHPLEQSIWAPRGPHNESIGAVVQPLPTAHLIFRAPSQAAGHCWLDGLELALRCSNAMLRCSRPSRAVIPAALSEATNEISHEELEKHFNEHEISSCSSPTPLMSTSDYSPRKYSPDRKPSYSTKKKPRKISKWAQFVESIEMLAKDQEVSSDSSENYKKEHSFLDFLKKRESFDRNATVTSSLRVDAEPKVKKLSSKSVASSPLRLDSLTKKTPILRCFEIPKLPLPLGDKKIKNKDTSPTSMIEENLFRLVNALPKRRSSTPQTYKLTSKRISQLRSSGAKTDSENDDIQTVLKENMPKKKIAKDTSEVLCMTPDNIVITKTAPSVERFRRYSSSSTDEVCDDNESRFQLYSTRSNKYSLIGSVDLPSATFEALRTERRDDRFSSQNVYVAGKIVKSRELAGAASDSDSEGGMNDPPTPNPEPPKGVKDARERIEKLYVEDMNRDIGVAGELVEEVAEENKSLLWFLMKQVRPGMDLSKVVLPTFILEPRSFLDKLADNYYHADILGTVATQKDPYARFLCVLRWYLSGLYRKPRGLKKPYNPVLGETFRCCWKHSDQQTYTYYVSEQVSHHPPVSAFYVSNRKDGYVVEGSLLARSKFYGNSTSAILEGCAKVHLLNWDETYVTTAPYAHCKGIVIGTLSMELGGKVHVICEKTGYHAEVEFKLRSFLGSAEQTNSVSGRIKLGTETVAHIDGYWDGQVDIKDKKTGEETNLMDVAVMKEQRMPRYLVKLESQQDHESQKLWIKVSEAIAKEDQVAATEEKTIIEEAQRTRAKNQTTPWEPRLFRKEENLDAPVGVIDQGWRYIHGNITPWLPEEQFEYEDDYVIRSVQKPATAPSPRSSLVPPRAPSAPRIGSGLLLTDSDTNLDTHRRSKTNTRTLKQTLMQIDAAIRDQTLAIEKLSKTVNSISEGQKQQVWRPQNVGRIVATSHTWDVFGGFVLAVVLQALLNWILYQKD